jgi:transposase
MEAQTYIGVDISKDALEIEVRPSGERWQETNDETGVRRLAKRLADLPAPLVVCESTGGLERELVLALGLVKVPVAVMNPRRIHAFADALGRLAKNDRIDAEVIARFAEALHPEPRPLLDADHEALREVVTRREQLVEMRTMETNRRARATKRMRKQLDEHLTWLNKQIDQIDQEINRLLRSSVWREQDTLLRSAKGVGPVLSASLLAQVPELGRLSHKEIASLVGVAPFDNDSGKYAGRRTIKGGRAGVRTVLYMATLSAIRHNPVIRNYHGQLRQRGKLAKVAIVACMRKLLHILNAMMRDHQPWAHVGQIS